MVSVIYFAVKEFCPEYLDKKGQVVREEKRLDYVYGVYTEFSLKQAKAPPAPDRELEGCTIYQLDMGKLFEFLKGHNILDEVNP